MGYHHAGFDVVGVDVKRQPHYPFPFIQGDALRPPVRLDAFDLIHASPPCQRYSMANRNNGTAGTHPDLLPPTRELLEKSGRHYVIENVMGAPMRRDVVLCGCMFDLPVRRRRLFETSPAMLLLTRPCSHEGLEAVPVYGNGTPSWYLRRRDGKGFSTEEQRAAMGIDWMPRNVLSQAIPPAYTEFLGRAFLARQ